jgi:hypothetical protein
MASPSAAATISSYSRALCIEAPSPKQALFENIIGQKKRFLKTLSAKKSAYLAAPTLRRNATTPRLFFSMANLRGVMP